MQSEIEVKFLDVDHDDVRRRLRTLGAELEYEKRLMTRTVFDYPDHRIEKIGRLRVRNEGDKITVTFKRRRPGSYPDEIETTVGSYEIMVELLEAIGLMPISVQETRREKWHVKGVEVVLDEWPWVKPFIEIEGESEAAIKACAEALGFDWGNAKHGAAETAYRAEYPGLKADETIGSIPVIAFGKPLPEWLENRKSA